MIDDHPRVIERSPVTLVTGLRFVITLGGITRIQVKPRRTIRTHVGGVAHVTCAGPAAFIRFAFLSDALMEVVVIDWHGVIAIAHALRPGRSKYLR